LALKEALTEEMMTTEEPITVKMFEMGGVCESWKVWARTGMRRRVNAAGLYIESSRTHCPSLAATMVHGLAFGFG
jgi:hypothetical protein